MGVYGAGSASSRAPSAQAGGVEGVHSRAGHSQVEGGAIPLQEVRAAVQRDTDSCLVMRNLMKFSTFEAQFPGLMSACVLACKGATSGRGGQQGKRGPAASPGGTRGPVLSVSECSCVSASQKTNLTF